MIKKFNIFEQVQEIDPYGEEIWENESIYRIIVWLADNHYNTGHYDRNDSIIIVKGRIEEEGRPYFYGYNFYMWNRSFDYKIFSECKNKFIPYAEGSKILIVLSDKEHLNGLIKEAIEILSFRNPINNLDKVIEDHVEENGHLEDLSRITRFYRGYPDRL